MKEEIVKMDSVIAATIGSTTSQMELREVAMVLFKHYNQIAEKLTVREIDNA